jgi:hypothetical protein
MSDELRDRLIKGSTIKMTDTLLDSEVFDPTDVVPTGIPMIDVALSGSFDNGMMPGVTVLAGKSKMFKTGFALLLARAFLKKYPEGYILFYDSEFGSPPSYFKSFGIPLDRVIHTPVTELEELRHDIVTQINQLSRKDKVFIVVDSIGNLPSHKETEDAAKGSDAGDMGLRAKVTKSVFRVASAKVNLKHIPMVVIAHTYKTMEMYATDVVAGGTGPYYNADNLWIIGREADKDKDTREIHGYRFNLKIDKSRYVREGVKIPIDIAFDGGINKWSGLLDEALEGGFVAKVKKGNSNAYALVDRATGELIEPYMKLEGIESSEVTWTGLLKDADFRDYVKAKYTLSGGLLMGEDEHVDG